MSKIVIWSSNFNNNTCRKNSNILFIFGDNVKRKGYAGQAIIRDEKIHLVYQHVNHLMYSLLIKN